MTDSILWKLAMLDLIPKHPKTITAKALYDALKHNYQLSLKSVHRALETLSLELPILRDDEARPYGFSMDVRSKYGAKPLESVEAMATLMAKGKHGITSGILKQSTLKKTPNNKKQAEKENDGWPDKLASVGRGFQLQQAEIDPEMLDDIHEALIQEKQISFTHKGKKDTRIHPLAMVLRDQVIYLICSFYDYNKPLQLAIHRMSDVEILEEAVIKPEGFSLQAYIDSGELSYLKSKHPLKLKMLMTDTAAKHLQETPISKDQILKPRKDGKTLVSATVKDSQDLRWWILAFGAQVEVQQPKALRQEIQESLETAYKHYKA